MNICLNCGNIFEHGEAKKEIRLINEKIDYYGEWNMCPVCGKTNWIKGKQCVCCNGFYLPTKIYNGWCKECLEKSIDYYMAYDFLNEKNYMKQFVFEKYYESTVPIKTSEKLDIDVRERFLRMKTDDMIRNKKDFLNLIKSFILDDDGEDGKLIYSEWLNNREAKKNGKF